MHSLSVLPSHCSVSCSQFSILNITMCQIIRSSLSYIHKLYEMGMLKVSAVMYVCMAITYHSIVWINQVRLPILIMVSCTGKMIISLPPFAPENLVSQDGLAVPSRVSLLIFFTLKLNLVLKYNVVNIMPLGANAKFLRSGGGRMARGWRYTKPSLAKAPLRVARVRVCAMHPFYSMSSPRATYTISGICFFSPFVVVFALFCFVCSRWNFL